MPLNDGRGIVFGGMFSTQGGEYEIEPTKRDFSLTAMSEWAKG